MGDSTPPSFLICFQTVSGKLYVGSTVVAAEMRRSFWSEKASAYSGSFSSIDSRLIIKESINASLDDDDDVQNVYSNFDIDDKLLDTALTI